MSGQTAIGTEIPLVDKQIIIWEKSTRLEAGIKRELYSLPEWPDVRACRSAAQVVEKRNLRGDAVLVLDEATLSEWCRADAAQLADIDARHWDAVIAACPSAEQANWQWTAAGITARLTGPVHDGHLAAACLKALGWPFLPNRAW